MGDEAISGAAWRLTAAKEVGSDLACWRGYARGGADAEVLGTARRGSSDRRCAEGELKDLCAGPELSNHLVLTAPLTEGLRG